MKFEAIKDLITLLVIIQNVFQSHSLEGSCNLREFSNVTCKCKLPFLRFSMNTYSFIFLSFVDLPLRKFIHSSFVYRFVYLCIWSVITVPFYEQTNQLTMSGVSFGADLKNI